MLWKCKRGNTGLMPRQAGKTSWGGGGMLECQIKNFLGRREAQGHIPARSPSMTSLLETSACQGILAQ